MFARASVVLVVLVVMVLLFSPEGMGQQGQYKKKKDGGGDPNGGNQFGRGGGRPKGGGMGMIDPNMAFQWASKSTPGFVDIATYKFDKEGMEKFAKEKGITGGKLNQQQFAEYFDQKMKGGGFAKFGGPQAAPPTTEKPADKSKADLEKLAAEEFKKRDANGDGKLNYDEMDAQLRREMVHYDKNQDQLIDLQEYTAYFIDRSQQAERDKSQAGSDVGVQVIEDDIDVRPVVYRYGKLPNTLPEWFMQYDTNRDGLVSLAEWVNSKNGKTVDDFAAMDRDGDGFLTPEEVLRFNNGGSAPSEELAGGTGGSPGFGNRGFGGGQGGGGRGLLGLFGGGGGGMRGGQQGQGGQQGFVPGGGQGGGRGGRGTGMGMGKGGGWGGQKKTD